MLSKELQDLETNQMVKRTVLQTKPITVEYELTPYGQTVTPIITAMANWGQQHRELIVKNDSKQ
jgi:DNA-binding HxlR family transcriptional regulator